MNKIRFKKIIMLKSYYHRCSGSNVSNYILLVYDIRGWCGFELSSHLPYCKLNFSKLEYETEAYQ